MPAQAEFLQGLNNEQKTAVEQKNGPILVLAGAGSGKTKVLTSRIANLVKNGVNPNEILAVTFTNKAAGEMQTRLAQYLGEQVVKKMWVGTFHNICARILRRDLENYKTKDGRKWNNNYVIYDETDTRTIIKNVVKKLNLDEKIYDYKTIKSIISNAKNKMQDAYAFSTLARDYYNQKVSEIYYEYERQLVLNNALDFDDMLMLGVNLLKENEQIRKKYSDRFKHVLVDEFQDTNKAQYDLINMLYPFDGSKDDFGSLCAVGDVDQSIYSWRGADFKIILNFQSDYKSSKLIKLEQNYRSTQNILEAANHVIKNNEERLEKNLYSNKGEGEKITVYEANDDYDESRYIAKKIENSTYGKEDIAILYRTNSQSRSIEEALMSYSIPYKIVGGLKFYERKEIKDIVAYLKLIYNHNDSQSLKRIINEPKRSIGDTTVKKLENYANDNYISIYEAIKHIDDIEDINAKAKTSIQKFFAVIEELTSKQNDFSLSEYVRKVIEDTGYQSALKAENNIENQSRLENLQEFTGVAKEFEQDDFALEAQDDMGPLGNFLAQIALVSDIDEIDEGEKSVTLMTLHSAKGLEYPLVFLAGLEDGLFPHNRSIIQTTSNTDLEEERRLMYVGLTRAKEKLYLTYANQRKIWGNYQHNPKSRFLDEIPISLIEEENKISTKPYKSSFYGAVSKIKENKTKSTTACAPTTSLLSSIQRIKQNASKVQNEKKITATNNTKKESSVQKENLSVKELIAKAKQKALEISSLPQERKLGLFPIGTRVFHGSFGIGHIKDIKDGNYIVNFTKSGEKTLDVKTSSLKTF